MLRRPGRILRPRHAARRGTRGCRGLHGRAGGCCGVQGGSFALDTREDAAASSRSVGCSGGVQSFVLDTLQRTSTPRAALDPPQCAPAADFFLFQSPPVTKLVFLLMQRPHRYQSLFNMSSSKGKGKELEDPATWKGPWCVLLQGERATPIANYMKALGEITCTVPAPGESKLHVKGSLIPRAKEVLAKLISMVFRELDGGLCFTSLRVENIFVNWDTIVKIKNGNVLKTGTSDTMIEQSVFALGNMIHDLVTAASPEYARNINVNPELKHLLSLIRAYKKGNSTYLMRFHPCNVPDYNRGFYTIVLHDEIMDVIRYEDPQLFHYIIDGLEVPADWYTQMERNSILNRYLIRGHYATAGGVPNFLPLKCLRNVPSHGREDAGDVNGPSFTRDDIARAVYDKAPLALCSLAKALDSVGMLKHLKLENQFPGRINFDQEG